MMTLARRQMSSSTLPSMIGISSTGAASATRDDDDGLSLPRTRTCDPSKNGKTRSAGSFRGAVLLIAVNLHAGIDEINIFESRSRPLQEEPNYACSIQDIELIVVFHGEASVLRADELVPQPFGVVIDDEESRRETAM